MIKLSEISTRAPEGLAKKSIKKQTEEMAKRIGELSQDLEAEGKRSILVIFQGMDSSGKDGASRNVFKHVSPTIVSAQSFKKPTDLEFAHDFLWRVHAPTPRKGSIQIFNRSHYEDILIQRVHKWINEERVDQRLAAINAFEKLLQADNNTTILKFYMHLSREKQKEKLQERIDDPSKNWKHNDDDWKESERWDDYMICYEDAINRSQVPWIIAPVDQRWYRNYFIASKVLDTLEGLKMVRPTLEK